MKLASNETDKAIANGRQLALKLVANSLYGFTGAAEKGMLPAPEIASAVTFQGRKMAANTMRLCNQIPGCDTVYGDTDSVMVHFEGVKDVKCASDRASRLAEHITSLLPPPNVLEFEKIHMPFLLQKKKRYCGMKYDEGQPPAHLDVKGLEMVRRDNFPMLPNTMREMVNHIMAEDLEAAQACVKNKIVYLLSTPPHQIDLAQLTICRELTRKIEDYASKPPHVRVAERLPGVNVKDRISYIVDSGKGCISDRAVHPSEWNHEKNLVDTRWYANQLGSACGRLLELCVDDISDVLNPACTTVIATGKHGIPQMFGANENIVWTKRERKQQYTERKAKRQMTLVDILRRTT